MERTRTRVEDTVAASDQRLTELAAILTLGLMRLRRRKSSSLSPYDGESSLDFTAGQSGHADRQEPVETDE